MLGKFWSIIFCLGGAREEKRSADKAEVLRFSVREELTICYFELFSVLVIGVWSVLTLDSSNPQVSNRRGVASRSFDRSPSFQGLIESRPDDSVKFSV